VAAQDARPIRQLTLSQFTGHPVYFFDTSVLLDNVISIAGWNQTRLEAAIAPRVERILDVADMWIATDDGFYVVFANHTGDVARGKADAVRADLLRHFYGPAGFHPEVAAKLCRPSTLFALAGRLGISEENSVRPRAKTSEPATDEPAEGTGAGFAEELQAVFADAVALKAAEFGNFLFSPLWDSKKERISTFLCETDAPSRQETTPSLRLSAEGRCRHDVAALAAATRGVCDILSRHDVGAVSVAVHGETLSWSKTKNAYLEMLGRVESRLRNLLVLRIVGLEPGANLSKIAEWTNGLHHHVRWIFVHLPDLNFDFRSVGVLSVTGYGLTAALPEHPDATSLNMLSAQAAKLSRICANQAASSFMDNVVSREVLTLLKHQGVRFFAGPAIGASSESPGIVGAFSLLEQSPQLEVS
jgi:hypothetical protein